MATSLYGPDGFFTKSDDPGPAGHFRTSAHVSRLFGWAMSRLLVRVDAALGHPARLDVVDIGAGRGELLSVLLASVPADVAARIRATAVELAPRPSGLPPRIGWQRDLPAGINGFLIATEWLDNVPLDVAVPDRDQPGSHRYLRVDRQGTERLGPQVSQPDAAWLARWWPGSGLAGSRAEVGATRDAAWRDAVSRVTGGLALTVDYGHTRQHRPATGTLTGYRGGRAVSPVPDGSCDLTAHVAMDAVAQAGAQVAGVPGHLLDQRAALRAMGIDGSRPSLSLASSDPAGYLRQLALCGEAAELTEPSGLGGHWWLIQPVRPELSLANLGLAGCETSPAVPTSPDRAGDTVPSGENEEPEGL